MSEEDKWERVLFERGHVINLGQITAAVEKHLNRLVREGRAIRYRGYWNTLSESYGFGPKKTIWVPAV